MDSGAGSRPTRELQRPHRQYAERSSPAKHVADAIKPCRLRLFPDHNRDCAISSKFDPIVKQLGTPRNRDDTLQISFAPQSVVRFCSGLRGAPKMLSVLTNVRESTTIIAGKPKRGETLRANLDFGPWPGKILHINRRSPPVLGRRIRLGDITRHPLPMRQCVRAKGRRLKTD